MASGVLAQHEPVAVQADRLRLHDLVGQLVLEHAVLVNAGLVCERVVADDRLVDRHRDAGDLRQKLAGRINLLADDVGLHVGEHVLAGLDGHDDFFHGRVAGPLADPVDRAFYLAGAVFDRGQRVGDGEAEVVVAVRAPGHVAAARHLVPQPPEQRAELLRNGVADRIGHVDGHRARLDDFAEDPDQKVDVGARRVLRGELDVVEMLLGVADRPDRGVDALLAAHHQLVFEVNVGGGDEDVGTRMLGLFDRLYRAPDVVFLGARQAQHDGRRDQFGDPPNRLEVALRRRGEPGLDHVHVQLFELPGDHDFLLDVHGRTGRLFSVA